MVAVVIYVVFVTNVVLDNYFVLLVILYVDLNCKVYYQQERKAFHIGESLIIFQKFLTFQDIF